MAEIKIYYADRRGTVVTQRHMRTALKDEDLRAIRSVRISREPLVIAAVGGIGLALFAFQFGDLLFFGEQLTLALVSALLLFAGWSLASLKIGLLSMERTVLWGRYATLKKVREAILQARTDDMNDGGAVPIVIGHNDHGHHRETHHDGHGHH